MARQRRDSLELVTDIEMLPHEYVLLHDVFDRLVAEQNDNAHLLGAAMDQSSETDHDNSPAEAIRDRQNYGTFTDGRRVLKYIEQAVVRPYPEPESPFIAPGTKVVMRRDGDDEEERYGIGFLSIVNITFADPNAVAITTQTPIGEMLLGRTIGRAAGEVNGVHLEIDILEADQAAIRDDFGPLIDRFGWENIRIQPYDA